MATATEKVPVTMEDGRVVEFGKKQKLAKSDTIADNGDVSVRLDFVNGQTRLFTVAAASQLFARFAAHGASQKLGDAIAGETDLDDAVLAVDDLIARLTAGEWTVRREAGSMAGTSVLIRALMEASGKELAEVKAFLENKTQADKLALRKSAKIKPIIERIEAEKASNSKSTVDTEALLGELGLTAPEGGKKNKATEPA